MKEMTDIFDHPVLCDKCHKKMKKIVVERGGFKIRALECPECGKRTYHPSDLEEYNKYNQLKGQSFQVKLRRVGNSYTVSIPREIINFFEEIEDPFEGIHKRMRENLEKMNKMVTLALEEANKISLSFSNENYDKLKEFKSKNGKTVVREKVETKSIPGGKGIFKRKMRIVKMLKNVDEEEK